MAKNELILLPSLKASKGANGGLVLTKKYLEGASEFARTWPGSVTTLIKTTPNPTTDLDHVEILPGDADTGLEMRPETPDGLAARLDGAAIALGFLSTFEEPTVQICHEIGLPIVVTAEYSTKTQKQIIDAGTSNPILRLRRRHWLWKAQRSCRRVLRMVDGLQCSGTPTYDEYRDLQPDALVFFDNRVRADGVIGQEMLAKKCAELKEGKPLRLVFGGRFIPMKGVQYLPEVAAALRKQGVPFTLDIYGGGPLEDKLKADIAAMGLQDCVRLPGVLDFRTGWIPTLMEKADLFVCCHPQGDPSSTYPEVMSCGVPIVGFENEAFAGVVQRSGSGFLTPMNNPQALADKLVTLSKDRDLLVEAANTARSFALEHSFEATFKRRAEFLINISERVPA